MAGGMLLASLLAFYSVVYLLYKESMVERDGMDGASWHSFYRAAA